MSTSDSAHLVYVALLRGVNVGGRNRLPMEALKALLVEQGHAAVKTYIQSGNAVFTAHGQPAEQMARCIGEGLSSSFGLQVPVVLRSADELLSAAAAHPLLSDGVDPKHLHVGFLSRTASPEQIARLDPRRSPPDRFLVVGDHIYLHFPNGVARSKLTSAYLDSRLGAVVTVRNWKTVQALVGLVKDASPETGRSP